MRPNGLRVNPPHPGDKKAPQFAAMKKAIESGRRPRHSKEVRVAREHMQWMLLGRGCPDEGHEHAGFDQWVNFEKGWQRPKEEENDRKRQATVVEPRSRSNPTKKLKAIRIGVAA